MTNWLPRAARIGYAAKGATYVLMGTLALQSALIGDTKPENTRGALQSIDGPAAGKMLLAAIAFGLGAYALWKFYLGAGNPQHDNWGKRFTAFVVAFTNAGFALEAATLSLSIDGPRQNGDQAVHWSALIMEHRSGMIAVGVCGAFVALYGLSQIVRALRRKVDEQLHRLELQRDVKRWVLTACKFGMGARGVVFTLVGWFLIKAARDYNPGEARDFGNSLREMRAQPMGRTLLSVVALGFFAYAFYQFLRARFDRFEA